MNRTIWPAAALALAALGPAACSGGESEQATETAGPEAPAGISVSDGRMMLPPVSGNPAAIYFDIANDGDKDVMIRAVSVQGAGGAMLHETSTWNNQTDMQEVFQLSVPAGESVSFEPGGLHVMANDLDPSLVAGGETEVTLTFVGGDKVSFPAEIREPGDER
ncbi:hypothetical protein FHS61_002068 [Altererythrobacter atlanticus]|uniref:Uncharacterized protein n=1 Tax=Croceibacterium atlanticum TaxID=1267766 RepID=A0A0F7KS47_9SPHN|nr:copper chaperone PCu(A)C [Croceibacterium atlanticum]AKH41580.1 hypothetical protein WYH_00521 [Croceibacterium atlanticum]MBB5733042.1 hypothetical protein [Croceibacterium atlanticum]